MRNLQILRALEEQRDNLYRALRGQTLSERFKQEYQSLTNGTTFYFGETKEDLSNELKDLSNDTSKDEAFQYAVENIHRLDSEGIIKGFRDEIAQCLSLVRGKGFEEMIQAVLIQYDYYYHYKGTLQVMENKSIL